MGHPATIRLVLLAYRAACAALAGLLGSRGQPGLVLGRVATIIKRVGDIVFLGTDAEACRWGWTIERRRAGLDRRYRNPRFDTLAACPHCRGLGITAAESLCVKCAGTGRRSWAG